MFLIITMALRWFVLCVMLEIALGAATQPQDLGSPIRIAQCRAQCLDQFVPNRRQAAMCQQEPDCFTCWENCGLLQENPSVWGRMCNQPSICFPGCSQACRFYAEVAEAGTQKEPVLSASGEPAIRWTWTKSLMGSLSRGQSIATWPRPANSDPNEKIVYVVIQKQISGKWRQITQTAEERCVLSLETNSGALRVLAVNGKGLLALYRPEMEDATVTSLSESTTMPAASNNPFLRGDSVQETRESGQDLTQSLEATPQWKLREVSLIHQKVLVIAEIAWPSQQALNGEAADYLVTWEVDGGGLKGHLYTDATSVTLSLWPDTVYHIQVELVTGADTVQMRSASLSIDTHKAPVVTAEERVYPAAPLVDRMQPESSRRLEATVGVGAAAGVCCFLMVIGVAIGVRRQRRLRRSTSLSSLVSVSSSKLESLARRDSLTVAGDAPSNVHLIQVVTSAKHETMPAMNTSPLWGLRPKTIASPQQVPAMSQTGAGAAVVLAKPMQVASTHAWPMLPRRSELILSPALYSQNSGRRDEA